ncbi:large conductance mechanosensitive channel protein MscL [soil metagenome]
MINEFKEFLLRGNVIDLAVAVVIGAAFTAIVTAMVEGIINPLIALLVGEQEISDVVVNVSGTEFLVGQVIGAVINFVLVGLVLFVFIKAANVLMVARRDETTQEVPEEQTPEEIVLLRQIRDRLGT